MAKKTAVPRPKKKSECDIDFATPHARKGWDDLNSTVPNARTDAWDFLTKTPTYEDPDRNYKLKPPLDIVARDGKKFQHWQYKPTIKGDARIWFYIDGMTVYLEKVYTHHPNQTK
jgi:hypothetical protein